MKVNFRMIKMIKQKEKKYITEIMVIDTKETPKMENQKKKR